MSYSLKNKVVVLFATAFTFSVALANNVRAEEQVADATTPAVSAEPLNKNNSPAAQAENEVPADSVKNEAPVAPVENADDPFGLDDPLANPEGDVAEQANAPAQEVTEKRMPDLRDRNIAPVEAPANAFPQPDVMPEVGLDMVTPDAPAAEGLPDVAIDAGAPRSPFEKYGNAILSRVDNDLFNQMSEIEKQTTLLNLELKREEVKNRIEALKAQRERARQEELNMEAEREKKARDEELQRQKALLQEQMKLKEKEIEVEKIRQAKILSEYMNEALITNQQWVEANGKLTVKLKNLQEDRKKILSNIVDMMDKMGKRVDITMHNAEETKAAYERKIASLNNQIERLRQTIIEKENELHDAENRNLENPFANGDMIDENAVDMSKEYAIMDITGKGDNIVAKIVNQDGTTFIVRKGSVLKGGETVVSITDKYIMFDNKGSRSYLYTGGTVMQYEPTLSFSDAQKTPNVATGVVNNTEIRNVRGVPQKPEEQKNNSAPEAVNKAKSSVEQPKNPAPKSSTNSNGGVVSFSKGMMVK